MKSEYLEKFNQIDFDKIIDHPNILIAAKFWDDERYQAAKTCYKFMRGIDDLIDNHKSDNQGISSEQRIWFRKQVDIWLKELTEYKNTSENNYPELVQTLKLFKIPIWTLRDFADAMLYDIDNDGFATLNDFIKYSGGASVAPSSVFVHLVGLRGSLGNFEEPLFEVRKAAYPSAIFSYLVHIIRDFQKDQFDNLNYFADDLVIKHGLSRKTLSSIAEGAPIPDGFRALIAEYMEHADVYREKTTRVIENITPLLEPKYQLSLLIIFNLYLMVYERIDVESGLFTTKELEPTASEIKDRVYRTIMEFQSS